MTQPLITVIVPCYNVEIFLPKCVESIIGQSYKNLEIILVDDGSPDKCGQICDDYASMDSRIRVIHKKNGGLSEARNVGIDNANGDYLIFVDSDDWLHANALEKMLNSSVENKADIVVSNFCFVKQRSNEYINAFKIKKDKLVYNEKEALIDLFYQRNMETGAWGKLYKKELWKDIRFPIGKLFEDIPTIYKTFFLSKRIVVIPTVLYFYLLRETSIMGTAFSHRKMDAIYCSKMMFDDVMVRTDDMDLRKAARCRYISMCFNTIFQTPPDSEEEVYIWKEIIKNRKKVLNDFKARRKTFLALLLSYLGIRCLRRIYKNKR